MLNRLAYRAKQRGHLELDLLLGEFFDRRALEFNRADVAAASAVLGEENPDLWSWLTGQQQTPERLQHNPVFQVNVHQCKPAPMVRAELRERRIPPSLPLCRTHLHSRRSEKARA